MERETQHITLSRDEYNILNNLFPAPDQMGGRHLRVSHLSPELDPKVKEFERRGIVIFLRDDPGSNPANACWFLTNEGREALAAAEKA